MRVSFIITVIIIIIIDLMRDWEKAMISLKSVDIFLQEDEMQPEIFFF